MTARKYDSALASFFFFLLILLDLKVKYNHLLYTCNEIHLIQPIFLLDQATKVIFICITILYILPISSHKTQYLTANSLSKSLFER